MGLLDYLQQYAEQAGKNLDDQHDNLMQSIKDTNAQIDAIDSGKKTLWDAANEATPAQQAVYNQSAQTAVGSLSPMEGSFTTSAPLAGEIVAKDIANIAADTGQDMDTLARTQQQLSRAADMADRYKAQRFARIKNLVGQ